MLIDKAEALVRRFRSRDPIVIAKGMGFPFHHLYHPESKLPGLTCMVSHVPAIFLNDAYFEGLIREKAGYTEEHALDDQLQIIAHELGHCVLHRKQLMEAPIKEYQLERVHVPLEIEANVFASGIRIDREEMLELLRSGMDVLDAAARLHVNVNLLIYRIEALRREGYDLRELPYIPKNNFIGHIWGAGSDEWRN